MTALALVLVFGSAFIHATWNFLAKRVAGGAEFVWLVATVASVAFAPVVAVYALMTKLEFTLELVLLALVSGVIHTGYFVTLQRGYRTGDLSLVYPLARGTGPALATLLAIAFLGERPSSQALLGTLLVVVSVFILAGAGGKTRGSGGRNAVALGVMTGVLISLYTVFDGFAVGHAGASPLLFMMVGELWRSLLMLPAPFRNRPEVMRIWRDHKWATVGVGVLSPLAYVMVLTAMTFTPVSLVAPARELSILIGTIMGARLLRERHGGRRMLGATGMAAGVLLLAFS